MGRYLIRRTIISIFSLVAISMVVFGILAVAPGDPLSGFASNPNVPPELRERIRATMGLDQPVHIQYVKWASAFARGDWGQSYDKKIPARDYIFSRIPVTLGIVGTAFLLGIAIAIPVGVISALKQYSLFDQLSTTFAFIGFSIPTFFSGLLLIIVFSVWLGWLPFVFDSQVSGFWPNMRQSIMPITVLGLAGAAQLTRFVRASMLETINQDYVRTARAKGLREQTVVVLHAMRNAMIPVITIIAIQIPEIFGGAIITEQIFRIPGIGSGLISGIQGKDVPVVMGITFGVAILVVVFNVVADVLYAVLDPRIRYS
ncbi:MAG: ABC transporter, permease protein 1 (cluster 5, nickel/peptides/opines) [uncultured Thermomicrobiales bacterium]|uniref:ABC transporter, permease protein 1 (Cluster 5, nickel/peptides/opines) n=1 Tax=uncultured Thermomicrobiales bacterium TaxID=1645740 RepID=A0A6J4U6R0_9BACT|nr:MAG: ABC transporter, permease protein 1 (cluster 5, nickel/peptides/opines) [uncultured Thermomicrobiales bacterium]